MSLILIVVHVVVCLALVLIVLLQTGKGSDIGAAFGAGASQTVFGSQGSGGFLSKLTAAAAIVFMLTSLGLNLFTDRGQSGSVMERVPAPVTEKAPAPPAMPTDKAQPIETPSESQ